MEAMAERTDGSENQQVMSAQPTQASASSASRLEGETMGPDYGGQGPRQAVRPPPQLPNGVPRRSGSSPQGVEIESLPYSPMRLEATGVRAEDARSQSGRASTSATGPANGFFGEVWPTQPDVLAEPRGQISTPLVWMNRLADFLRTQVQGQGGAVETRTTVTRQQVMGQGGSNGGVLLRQEHLQTTSSQPVTPSATPPPRQEESFPRSEPHHDPPLFGNGARRLMETWPQRAPLLYGPQPASVGTDADSSGSIPRELVQAEVRRQVTEALEAQRRMMQELVEENSRLKAAVEQPGGATVASTLQNRGVPEGNLAHVAQSRGVPESNLANVAQSRGVPEGNLANVAQSRGVPEGNLDQVAQSRGVPEGNLVNVAQSRGVPEGNLDHVAQSRGVPGSNLDQVAQSRGVPGSNLDQVAQSRGVSGSNLDQVAQSRGVPTGGLASVAQGRRGIGGGMEHAGFYFGAATDEEDGTYRGRLRSGRVNVDVHGPRGASVDRRSSPLGRSIFRQPSPPGRGGSRSSGPRGHGFGLGDGKEPTPLDGDGYGLPAVERVYRQPNYQEAGTFGDYDVDPPPGLPQRERGEAPETTVQAGALEPETEEKAAGPKDPNPFRGPHHGYDPAPAAPFEEG